MCPLSSGGYDVPYDVESCFVFWVKNWNAFPLAAVSFLCAKCGYSNSFIVVSVCGRDCTKFLLETELSDAEFV